MYYYENPEAKPVRTEKTAKPARVTSCDIEPVPVSCSVSCSVSCFRITLQLSTG